MTRKAPNIDTLRALFARSGNQCAFIGCTNQLINHKNQFIGQICHIEAAEAGGERYNPTQTDEERRGYDNLILLCYEHHIETNDVEEFTVEKLKEIKKCHESYFINNEYEIDDRLLLEIENNFVRFWDKVNLINQYQSEKNNLNMPVDTQLSFLELSEKLNQNIDWILTLLMDVSSYLNNNWENIKQYCEENGADFSNFIEPKYYENPYFHPFWEMLNIGSPNITSFSKMYITIMNLKYLELELKRNPDNQELKILIEKFQSEVEEMAKSWWYVD